MGIYSTLGNTISHFHKNRNVYSILYLLFLGSLTLMSYFYFTYLRDNDITNTEYWTLTFLILSIVIGVLQFENVIYHFSRVNISWLWGTAKIIFVLLYLTSLVCLAYYTFNGSEEDSINDDYKGLAIGICIVFGITLLLYFILLYDKDSYVGSNWLFSDITSETIDDHKLLAIQQIKERLNKNIKKTDNRNKKAAMVAISQYIDGAIKTKDRRDYDNIIKYCSTLYGRQSFCINNINGQNSPFSFTNPSGSNNSFMHTGERYNYSRVLQWLSELNGNKKIKLLNPDVNSSSDRNAKFNNNNDSKEYNSVEELYKEYSKKVGEYFYEYFSGKRKDIGNTNTVIEIIKDPRSFSFKDDKNKCKDLISFLPIINNEKDDITNNLNCR